MTTRHPSQWWDRSWNPVTGCTPAGAGCDHCHALQRMRRHLPALRGAGNARVPETQVLCHQERREVPLKRRVPTVWLVSMLGDVFHEQVPAEFVADVMAVLGYSPQHTFCLLTKRPERATAMFTEMETGRYTRFGKFAGCPLPDELRLKCETFTARNRLCIRLDRPYDPYELKWPPPNLLLLASVWDQPSADAACAALSQLRGVRWGLHCEPMLGPTDMRQTECNKLTCPSQPSWVVVGAEQGPGAMPFDWAWARSLRDQCAAASVPFWFKSGPKRAEPPPDLLVRETPWVKP